MAGKKQADASLKGKRPTNKSRTAPKSGVMRNPSHIGNKLKRREMYGKYLHQKRLAKDAARQERKEREAQQLGEEGADAIQKRTPRTLDNTREEEPTLVPMDDPEILGDEADDEFAPYFQGDCQAKVLITTRPRPSQHLFYFIADLQQLIPGLEFYPRKHYSVKEICQFASSRQYTHVIILSEKNKKCNGMTISHVKSSWNNDTTEDEEDNTTDNTSTNNTQHKPPKAHFSAGQGGPTAFFKLSNVVTRQNIPKVGRATSHVPELNLHGFGTRLGHRIGRLLGSIFPHNAELQGRQVVTFHNQRDYIFVRHHRYIFDELTDNKRIQAREQHDKANPMPHINTRLQELGPRFTLKLRWLQEGIFDTQFGEYEWIHKRKEMDVTRRKFHL